ncbi:MAG: hypothetical protein J6J01_11760 [Oscillospiraceae bacterium]|nr:hypothetical protein [Oscillospiraceae bacterium]
MATDNIFGIVISYRVEMRDGGAHPTIVMSTKLGQISVDSNPARISQWWARIKGAYGQPSFLRLLPSSLTDRLFAQLVAAWSKAHVDGTLDKNAPGLPLGVLLRGLGNELRSKDVTATAAKRRENAIAALLEHEGSAPWELVTPDRCRSWLPSSPSQCMECAAVMHRLYTALAFRGVFNPDPWSGFSSSLQPKEPSIESLRRWYLTEKSLDHNIIRQIIDDCLSIRDAVSVAILLMLFLKLSADEICALAFGSFCRLTFFDGTVVIINKVYKRLKQNYRVQSIDAYDAGILPVPEIIEDLINQLRADAVKSNNNKAQNNIDALPIVGQSNNRCARMTPPALIKEINNRLGYIDVAHGQSIARLLKNTAGVLATTCGFDDDQVRYFLRLTAKSTAARHYASFASEEVLFGMAKMIDLSINEIISCATSDVIFEERDNEDSKNKTYLFHTAGSLTEVKAKIKIKKELLGVLSEIGLFSESGFSANVKIKDLEVEDGSSSD